ncbi:Guanylyl cyclase (fragment) [Mesorhizobium prunaredense]|uniref:Guanylyl cyclase n=1 Tax=Mesorhizobium prunaredense TaxID=1631249 RepID=A0A1R3V284_9HYPH
MVTPQFKFGEFVLNASTGTFLRNGAPVPIGYRVLLLLTKLLERAGEVVGKAELMDAAWPGMAVEESNLSVQMASLRRLLGTTAGGVDWIATVPRLGYRFVGPVETVGPTDIAPNREPGPSICVLPFANLSEDAEQQFFADGLAEDLIMRLGRLRWLFVSARNSSFGYRGKTIDVKQIGRELGVRYVLNGSVRRSGERLRIGAEVSDTLSGHQVWSEHYDVERSDFLTVQDRICDSVIGAIEPKLFAAEHQRFRASPPGNLDAWGFVMRAMPHVWTWWPAADIDAAEALLRQATALDPNYPRANCLLACMRAARGLLGIADSGIELAAAHELAEQAIQHDPEDPWTHFAAGFCYMVSRRFDEAVGALSEAISINPSLAIAHMILGSTYGYGGFPKDGFHHLAIAERLSPRDFTQAANLSIRGMCHFVSGDFLKSVELETRAVKLRPHFGTAWRTLAAAAGIAGDHVTAGNALERAIRLQPLLSADWIERCYPMVRSEHRRLYLKGLRLAGLT